MDTLPQTTKRHPCALVMIAVLPALALGQSKLLNDFSPPETISVGNTAVLEVPARESTESIQRWLDLAVGQSSGNHTVRLEFAPGANYRVGASDGETVLNIDPTKNGRGPENLVIDGKGCTFTVTSWSRFMKITRARNVILKNFRVTYDPKNITQGAIVKSVDPSAGIYEVEIDPGHPMPDSPRFTTSDLRWIIVMVEQDDGSWGMKPGGPSTIGWKSERYPIRTGERSVKLQLGTCLDHGRLHGSRKDDPLLRDAVEVGDRVAILSRTNGSGVFTAVECHALVYRNIEINHSPASAFGDHYGERNCYIGITVHPSEGELFTTTADGIFVTNQRNGPWIEDCHLQGIGDDAVVLKNSVGFFKGPTENEALPHRIGGQDSWFSVIPGDRLAVYDMSKRSLVSRHKVISVSSEKPWGDKDVALDQPMTHDPGNDNLWIYNLDNQCNGFVLKNNTFMDHRRWGVLCSGADGSILSNRFIRSQNAAVYLVNSDNYFDNRTGAVPRNIEIIGNRFEDCWHAENAHPFGVIAARMNGRIDITRGEPHDADYGVDWNGIEDIRIENNSFLNWDTRARIPLENRSMTLTERPVHGIFLRDVSNVSIAGNQFSPSEKMHAGVYAIKVNDFTKVRLEKNAFGEWPGGSECAISKSGGGEQK